MKTCLKYTLLAVIGLFLIYFITTPMHIEKEITLEPVWIQNIATAELKEYDPNVEIFPFQSQSQFGYFDIKGRIYLSHPIESKVSVTNAYWCTYSNMQESTTVYKTDGNIQCVLNRPGFAHLTDYRFYIFLPGGDGVAAYNKDGSLLWIREASFPITAFNASESVTAIGYADGKIVVVNDLGTNIANFKPAGSNYEVILGLDISEDGTMIACVSGIERQRFILAKITGEQFKIIHHEYLPEDVHRQLYVRIDEKHRVVYYEHSRGLGIYDIKAKQSSVYPLNGEVTAIATDPASPFTFILEKSDILYNLSVLENTQCIAKTSFTAQRSFLMQKNNDLFLGQNDNIVRIKIMEK